MVVQLTSILEGSTSLLLAYSLPLLLLSVLLAFSGTFLTLDRTRTFAPRSETIKSFPGAFEEKRRSTVKWAFRLEGGIGGLVIGFIFGLHTVTFLTLLILNKTTSSPLSPIAFFLTWLFSVLLTTALGGRWRIAALVFLGLSGGITLSLGLSIIIHPSLSSRVALTSVLTPLTALTVIIPSMLPSLAQSNLAHWTARISSSCSGAFSTTMGVALLTRSPLSYSWANIWERLWVTNGSGWGSAREKGFDALFCVLWASGAVTDWALRRWIGEDPEEKWDAYLAGYSATLPNSHDRAGQFSPQESPWKRLLRALHLLPYSPASPHEIVFPGDKDFSSKADYSSILGSLADTKPVGHLSREDLQRSVSPNAYSWETVPPAYGAGVLRKGKSHRKGGFKHVPEGHMQNSKSSAFDLGRQPTHLQKAKSARVKHRWHRLAENERRPRVEFRPKEGFSSESDSEGSSDDDLLKKPIGLKKVHPLTRVNSKASTVTLSGTTAYPSSSSGHSDNKHAAHELNVDSEKARLKKLKSSFGGVSRAATPIKAPEYSDVEEDVTTAYAESGNRDRYDTPDWKPEFLRRALHADGAGAVAHQKTAGNAVASPSGAVPMTPSLITALGRIAKAQTDAYGPQYDGGVSPIPPVARQDSSGAQREHVTIVMDSRDEITGLPIIEGDQQRTGEEKAKWDTFWNEIQVKATEA
ncbi:hypothetical protein ACEPAI_9256 [Sanghuangporus weigelae]